MDNIKNLAIIPARSGSKGLKDKNIKLLNGKPMLAYSIEAAIKSGIFDEVYVSTDSKEYAEIAKKYGAKVPFLRSEATATGTASSWDVVREALQCYNSAGVTFDMIALLQPTTPLRTAQDIQNAFAIFNEKQANAVISICEVDHSPKWCNTLPQDHSLTHFIKKDIYKLPRQSIETYYRINGAIYMVKVKYFEKSENIYDTNSVAYIMDRERSIDIDDEFDFKMVQAIMSMD